MTVTTRILNALYWLILAASLLLSAGAAVFFWHVHELTFAATGLLLCVVIGFVYLHPRLYNYRFIAPALLVLILVIVVPILSIVQMSLTNLSESNKLNYQRALPYLLNQTFVADGGQELTVFGWESDQLLHVYLQDTETDDWYTTAPFTVSTVLPADFTLTVAQEIPEHQFDRKFAISARAILDQVILTMPDGRGLSKSKLRTFAERQPRFIVTDKHQFQDQETGDTITANFETGQFEITASDDEDRLGGFISPTFTHSPSMANYARLFLDTEQLKIFARVFGWTVIAATLTVTTSFLVALMAASLLNWPNIRERELYKFLIVGCYALPAFAVIHSFFILFSTDAFPWGDQNLSPGPIFRLGIWLFGQELDWQFNPMLARLKFLIVQFWMFMPLMFIVCLGVIQSIPKSVYEAARLEGAGTRQTFLKITLPLSFIPLAPVLLIAFATAFNDLALVDQLTFGAPEIPHSVPRASYVDLLVSFANRQAFGSPWSRGMGFGFYSLASTLFTLIFVVLAFMSFVYLRLVKPAKAGQEY